MDFHRWSSLLRGYDVYLRHNQLILILTAAGALWGIFAGGQALWPRTVQAAFTAALVFLAAALAKEIDPDRPRASVAAAILALAALYVVGPAGPVALFWLLGCLRLINRSTGLPPKLTDVLALLAGAAWLSWREGPIFGVLMGACLVLDALLPDGRRANMIIGAIAIGVATLWLFLANRLAEPMGPWLAVALSAVAVAFIAFVILNSYQVRARGDVTSERLNPSRVQAGQAFALGAGLSLASWRGEPGVVLLAGLWAALLGVLAYYLLFFRFRRSAASL
jgi:hypothetical protein